MKRSRQFSAWKVGLVVVAVAISTLAGTAQAATVLTFEGLQDTEAVQQYYDGGLGGNWSGPGPSYGIEFLPNPSYPLFDPMALIDIDAGGGGDFGGEPSPSTVLVFVHGLGRMNVSGGFQTGFSCYYAAGDAGSITVYDGLDATGVVLATLELPATPLDGAPDPTGTYSPFLPVGVAFSGTAYSVDFELTATHHLDNITLGSETPLNEGVMPEPAALDVIGAALLLVLKRRRS